LSQLPVLAFLFCAAAILYILAIYPLLLAWLARLYPSPVQKNADLKTVTVVMAVHNGARFLEAKLASILALDYPRHLVHVLVVSDGSTDATDAIAASHAGDGVELVRMPRAGKAAALNAGIARAGGEILLFTDVRQHLDPACLRRLVECFADPAVGVASGELVILRGEKQEEEDIGLYRRYENWIRQRLSRIDSIFGATGCLYAMRRDLAKPIPEETLLDDVVLPMAAFFRGYRLIFEQTARAADYPTTLDTEFRRKVRTLAGNYQLIRFFPGLLGPSNRMWLHFVSYKLGRLWLPYLLVGLFISSFWLPGASAPLALSAQGLLYALAAVDSFIPQSLGLKRISSPARTFVVLMLAAACAGAILFVPARTLWKENKIA